MILAYRTLRWGQRYLPPGVRSAVGLVMMTFGVFGFLPVLGFWMFPLGVAITITDFPPLRRRAERWLNDTRKRYHMNGMR